MSQKTCCSGGTCSTNCTIMLIAQVLVIVGALNWGLVGLSILLNGEGSWNLVHAILGEVPVLEAIVYLLVAISGVYVLVGLFSCEKKSPEMKDAKMACTSCESGVCETHK